MNYMTTDKIINGVKIIEYDKCNIYVMENMVDEKFCKKYINLIKELEKKKSLKNTVNDENYFTIKCDYFELDRNDETMRIYDMELYDVFHNIFEIFKQINPHIFINGDTRYVLRKIFGTTDLHTDEVRSISEIFFFNQIRTLTAVINLNDDYEGGIFNFPKHDVSIKLKTGSVILFPPFWTHPHQISKPENNKFRYTITTWGTENIINK